MKKFIINFLVGFLFVPVAGVSVFGVVFGLQYLFRDMSRETAGMVLGVSFMLVLGLCNAIGQIETRGK